MTGMHAVRGEPLPPAERVWIGEGREIVAPADSRWTLRGTTSHIRYTNGDELGALQRRQAGLGRPQARRAALIPISKSAEWWAMPQDARRQVFEETSQHIAIGLDYLPAVARRLHHGRDLGETFDFLTWFEFAAEDEPAFDAMLERLRATREWDYVTRECDIRLERA
ncbi:MAG: chlorite dismutase [Methylobacterium sp.]|nr:MAG: chlorite dismutase [Methylobacterium sp.]